MGGVRRGAWDGDPLPVTELLCLYRDLRKQPQKVRVQKAEELAENPSDMAAMFERSVGAFSSYRNNEPFHRGHAVLEPLPDETPIVRGRDVARLLGPSAPGDVFHEVAGIPGLALRLLDYELEPTRTTGRAKFEDETKAVQGMTLDLLMCDPAGVPAVCEVKTPGDMDPFFGLVQALACTAHLATPAQQQRLVAWVEGLEPTFDRFDVFVILIKPTLPKKATYQSRLREAALEIAQGLSANADFQTRVRHLALLDGIRGSYGLSLAKAH